MLKHLRSREQRLQECSSRTGVGRPSNEDQSYLRAGYGAKNMAVVRHFAPNLGRAFRQKKNESAAWWALNIC